MRFTITVKRSHIGAIADVWVQPADDDIGYGSSFWRPTCSWALSAASAWCGRHQQFDQPVHVITWNAGISS